MIHKWDKKVLIAAPVRNRAWILPEYLKALQDLDYPKELISFAFLVNDSSDKSLRILNNFSEKALEMGYRGIRIEHVNTNGPEYKRTVINQQACYRNIATLRNRLKEMITDEEYYFSVDSDIIVPPHALKKLISNDKPICAGVIFNDLHLPKRPDGIRFFNLLVESETDKGNFHNVNLIPRDSVFEVDVTGAVYLMDAAAAILVDYVPHKQGEDVGFCVAAKRKGLGIWADSSVFCDHRMVKS